MPTRRLYHEDSYLKSFHAMVTGQRPIDGHQAVALDRTAFYPTGGGQPHDRGHLNGVVVVDVQDLDGEVWHVLESPLEATAVQGEIDWSRRWDHMQNHSGQHVLSQAFVLTANALTVGWHLSDNSLTIDVDRTGLDEDDLALAEQVANRTVQEDRPVRARLVAEADLPALNLRKQPDIEGPLRIVEIQDYDQVACSGTHVASTAQVGLIKVLRAERRGSDTRLHFVCGQRAGADYARKHQLVRSLAARFSCSEEELLEAVDRLQVEAKANYKALKAAQSALVEVQAAALWAAVEALPAPRLVVAGYPEWEPGLVKQLALAIRQQPGCLVFLAGGDPPQGFVTRSDDVAVDAGTWLRAILAQAGGRGGGRRDYAQGSLPDWPAARLALEQAADLLPLPTA